MFAESATMVLSDYKKQRISNIDVLERIIWKLPAV